MDLKIISISNASGIRLELSNYGAGIVRLQVPDRNGELTDVIVGPKRAEDYLGEEYRRYNWCMGASIGRYAGRIGGSGFTLNDKKYSLSQDNGVHLHGGRNGFQNRYWNIEEVNEGESPCVIFSYRSDHLEEGYPGALEVKAKYQLIDNMLEIVYSAQTDRPTVINLTNHAYFNLEGSGSILGNELYINSSKTLEVNELFPTGKILDSSGGELDYSNKKSFSTDADHGLDTTFILESGDLKASLYSKSSGILMEVFTNQAAIVVFTPKDFKGMKFRNNDAFDEFPAICFECQNYPDAPNHAHFPSPELNPGEVYENRSSFRFSIRED